MFGDNSFRWGIFKEYVGQRDQDQKQKMLETNSKKILDRQKINK